MVCFEYSQAVFWSVWFLRAKTYHKAVYRSYCLRSSDPDAKYWLVKQFLGLKVTQQSWLFLLAFFPPLFLIHLFFLLLPFFPLFFPFAGHLVGFILGGNVFRKAFRILGLDERKGRWVVEQDFHGNFQLNLTWVWSIEYDNHFRYFHLSLIFILSKMPCSWSLLR